MDLVPLGSISASTKLSEKSGELFALGNEGNIDSDLWGFLNRREDTLIR